MRTRRTLAATFLATAFAVALGAAGFDDITGTPGDDVLTGTNAADTITADGGNDQIDADAGNDEVDAGPGNDVVRGGPGNDTIRGGAGRDNLDGGDNHDEIYGGADDDTITGGDGNDKIRGGAGDDAINGGPGNDTIVGGTGTDTYAVSDTDGNDRVIIRAGDVPTGAVETIRCGGGRDKVVFHFTKDHAIPGTRQVRDPDTGGIYEIAEDCERINFSSDNFQAFVDPGLTPSTTVGQAGETISVEGAEFALGATIAVVIADERVAETETDGDGGFSVSFALPQLEPGTYLARFVDDEHGFEMPLFVTVTAPAPAAAGRTVPLWVALGSVIVGVILGFVVARRRGA